MARPKPRDNAARAAAMVLMIQAQVAKAAGKGLEAGARFLASRIKEALSVPAPRKLVKLANGDRYYRATTRAVPNAPPRKLSGKLRQSVTSKMLSPTTAVIGVNVRSVRGFNYGKYHEVRGWRKYAGAGKHRYMQPTAAKYRKELKRIIGRAVKTEFR